MPAAPPLLGSTGSTTMVLAVLLVALGVAMLVAGLWLARATRTDTPALGPLEVMGDRRFGRRDGEARAAALAGARPEGAVGPAPMIDIEDDEPAVTPETVELAEPEQPAEPAGPDEPAEAAQQAH